MYTNSKISKTHFPAGCHYYIIDNIKNQTEKVISSLSPNSTLFVLFSGHGYQTIDRTGDEKDGRDEYVRTRQGMLLDDDIHDMFLYRPDISVVAMVDVCHSGSLCDLEYSYTGSWANNRGKKCQTKALVLGACQDSQLENCDITETYGYGGALTVHMLENDLLKHLISCNKKEIIQAYARIKNILAAYRQEPVLQSSKKFI